MKLLFDHHLSPKLVKKLSSAYPDSNHVYALHLDTANDEEIWHYAKENEYAIVTKDSDYELLATLKGFPPYVVWIRMGNCTTSQIESALIRNQELINSLGNQQGIIEIF